MRKALVAVMALGAACSSAPASTSATTTAPSASTPVPVSAPASKPGPTTDSTDSTASSGAGDDGEAASPPGVAWSIVRARAAHTATTLPDGGVLVAGGCVADGCGEASAETFVVSHDGATVAAGPSMADPRDAHTATMLDDGRVVLVGGYPGEGVGVLDSIEVIDPVSMTSVVQSPLGQARGGHAAVAMADGDVLVVGGWIGARRYTAAAESFDPDTGGVRSLPDAPYAADALDAVLLQDGRVLVTGGQVAPGRATAAAATFDPATGTWSLVGEMSTPRLKHFSVLLPDGRVLVMGGSIEDELLLRSTEIFDPVTDSFAPGPDMNEPRYKFPGGAVVLDDGRVAIAGGGRTTEILDLADGTTQVVAESAQRGSFATLNLLGSGDLLIIGGYDDRIRLRDEMLIVPAPSA